MGSTPGVPAGTRWGEAVITIDISDVLIVMAVAIPVSFVNKWVVIWSYKRSLRKREERFLKVLKIDNPNATITFISASSDEQKVLDEIEQKYREVR